MTDKSISSAVRHIVSLLVTRNYSGLEKLTDGRRLDADEIAQAVKDYGDSLEMPPEDAFKDLDIIEVESAQPKKWSVRFALWTATEGKSDLTLELTLTDVGDDNFDVEIANIYVL